MLVKDSKIDWDQMRRTHMGLDDLLGALRAEGVQDPSEVKEACLERSGDVSVVKDKQDPRLLQATLERGTLKLVLKLE